MRAMQSSTSAARSVSTDTYADSTACSCIVASVTIPVRPMPPAVAQNASGSEFGSTATAPWRRRDQLHPLYRVAEAPEPVLAVDVGGDRAADGDVAGTGNDHGEPAERDERAHQRVEAHARFDRAPPLLHVELEHAVHVGEPQHRAAGVLRGIAVTATEATREHATRTRARHLVPRRRRRGAVPARTARVGAVRPQPVSSSSSTGVRHQPCTATAKSTAQAAPITSSVRSESTSSSGAPP